jgi:transposase
MKTQLSKPARSKARYTEEYKKEALELWRASGRSAAKVAAELGIRPPLLSRWAQLERESKSSRLGFCAEAESSHSFRKTAWRSWQRRWTQKAGVMLGSDRPIDASLCERMKS